MITRSYIYESRNKPRDTYPKSPWNEDAEVVLIFVDRPKDWETLIWGRARPDLFTPRQVTDVRRIAGSLQCHYKIGKCVHIWTRLTQFTETHLGQNFSYNMQRTPLFLETELCQSWYYHSSLLFWKRLQVLCDQGGQSVLQEVFLWNCVGLWYYHGTFLQKFLVNSFKFSAIKAAKAYCKRYSYGFE